MSEAAPPRRDLRVQRDGSAPRWGPASVTQAGALSPVNKNDTLRTGRTERGPQDSQNLGVSFQGPPTA